MKTMRMVLAIVVVAIIFNSCKSRTIKYSGFNDLVVGAQELILYDNNEFYLELGLGGVEGQYQIEQDLILLEYYNKPANWPDKILMTKRYFEIKPFGKNKHRIKIVRNDNKDYSLLKSKTELDGEWLLTTRLFDSLLIFESAEVVNSDHLVLNKYTFGEHTLDYELVNPIPGCGNGVFYIDSSSYKIQNGNCQLFFKGGFALESTFTYHAEYAIDSSLDEQLRLRLIKIFENNRKNLFDE